MAKVAESEHQRASGNRVSSAGEHPSCQRTAAGAFAGSDTSKFETRNTSFRVSPGTIRRGALDRKRTNVVPDPSESGRSIVAGSSPETEEVRERPAASMTRSDRPGDAASTLAVIFAERGADPGLSSRTTAVSAHHRQRELSGHDSSPEQPSIQVTIVGRNTSSCRRSHSGRGYAECRLRAYSVSPKNARVLSTVTATGAPSALTSVCSIARSG